MTPGARLDSSSKVGRNNRWGFFPSLSGAWVVSDEDFMKDVSWISKFKVRMGYGKSGNLGGIDSYFAKQLSADIDKATTAVINARLSLESSIRQTQREEGVLGAAVNTISGKVDTINKHIDHVMEDAPTKLKVTVNVSDDDWEKMQGHHTQWLGEEKQMLADQYKQQEVLWQKHSQRLTEIVRNNEGVWLSAKLFYIVGSLSLLSIITIVLEIAFYVYFHWIQ